MNAGCMQVPRTGIELVPNRSDTGLPAVSPRLLEADRRVVFRNGSKTREERVQNGFRTREDFSQELMICPTGSPQIWSVFQKRMKPKGRTPSIRRMSGVFVDDLDLRSCMGCIQCQAARYYQRRHGQRPPRSFRLILAPDLYHVRH